MIENLQDAAARQLLETLADVNRCLRDHAVELRRSGSVTKALTSLEAVSYQSGPVLEGYVDAELANGDGICWCLDVRWMHGSWIIEASLDKKSGDRQKTVGELPSLTIGDFDGFLHALRTTVRELLALPIPEVGEGQ